MKNINHSYLKTAYILYLFPEEDGKIISTMPNPELCNSIPQIQDLMKNINKNYKKQSKNKYSINTIVYIIPVELERVILYREKSWENPKFYIKKTDVMTKCLSLLDNYKPYRLLVAPCIDQFKENNILHTIQSVYLPTRKKWDWYKISHSNLPIMKGTEYLAIYKCGIPKVYDYEKNLIADTT